MSRRVLWLKNASWDSTITKGSNHQSQMCTAQTPTQTNNLGICHTYSRPLWLEPWVDCRRNLYVIHQVIQEPLKLEGRDASQEWSIARARDLWQKSPQARETRTHKVDRTWQRDSSRTRKAYDDLSCIWGINQWSGSPKDNFPCSSRLWQEGLPPGYVEAGFLACQ